MPWLFTVSLHISSSCIRFLAELQIAHIRAKYLLVIWVYAPSPLLKVRNMVITNAKIDIFCEYRNNNIKSKQYKYIPC